MSLRKLSALVAVPVLALSLTACSKDGGGKPSKDDYNKALTSLMEQVGGDMAGTDQMKSFIDCMVDESYDKLSEDSLKRVVKDGASATLTDKDTTILDDASTACMSKLLG